VSAEDVGEFGLLGNNVVLGEADVESSLARPRFVRVTAVTVMGHRVPVVLGQRVARLREPGRYQVRRRWSYRAGDPCRLPCRPQRRLYLFPLRGLCRPNYGGGRWVATDGSVQQRADIHGRWDDPPGHPQHAARLGTFIYSAPTSW